MKNFLLILFLILSGSPVVFSQTFEKEVSDAANYNYRVISNIYEENDTFSFFLVKSPLVDSIYYYGKLNYVKIDSLGNIITDTILFPDLNIEGEVLKTKNYYYVMTYYPDKLDSMNGRIFQLDSTFNIVNEKKLALTGDSTFLITDIVEVENNNIVFNWYQWNNGNPRSIMLKTTQNLDSLHFTPFPFFSPSIVNDTINHYYVATPMAPQDTIFAYISYDLSLDSVQLAPEYLPQILSCYQNSVLLLNNHKKIYSNTSVGSDYYMAIYLFDRNMQVLNYHIIESDAYPGEYSNLSYIPNSPYFYFVGSTNYMAYPEDSNSIILARLDTNLNIDYIHYFHHKRSVRPYYITTTTDKGCIIIGRIGYMNSSSQEIRGAFIIKLDSLGNLTWSHGIDVQEQVALVYPNPAKDVLYVQNGLIKQKAHFTLFDIAGKQVFNKSLQPFVNNYNISELPSGVYIYRIASKDKLWQRGKIVKE